MVHRVHQIIELGARRVGLAELGEADPTPGAASVIGKEDRIAPRRENLGRRAVSVEPSVAPVTLGTPVHNHHQRRRPVAGSIEWSDQQTLEFESVPRVIPDHLLRRQPYLGEPRIGLGQTVGIAAALQIQPEDFSGMA